MKNKDRAATINIPEGFESLPKPFKDLIYLLLEEIKALKEENAELRLRLSKNSSNSNNPPSTDRFDKKSKPKSERGKSGKKTGGQPGHKGITLQPTEYPDVIQEHEVLLCNSCECDLTDVESTEYISRQECDVPPIKPIVTEHRMALKICPRCKVTNTAKGPKELTQPIQYGPRISTLSAYFHFAQLIPLDRIQSMFQDLFTVSISQGTLVNMHEKVFVQLESTEEQIKNCLLEGPVMHYDETSMRVNGQTQWLHVASNNNATAYAIHPKRGTIAMNTINILPRYKGTGVHDGWKPYFSYDHLAHALCNAHHLRELRAMFENYEQLWAKNMRELLLEIKQSVEAHKKDGKSELANELLRRFSATYDFILEGACYQVPHHKALSKSRGRIKQHPAKNLIDRLKQWKQETLRFMNDFRVPFTNNLGEQDIRMAKVKQKISGCFRSAEGADRFCRIRGYISTSKKRDINVFQALECAARGQPQAFHA